MRRLCTLIFLGACLASSPTFAQSPAAPGYAAEAQQAQDLLKKAVDHYQEVGDAALAEISRQGRFTTENFYVYVLNTNGVMLASGGPSAIYIGRDISSLLDDELKQAFANALTQQESGVIHSQEYRWMNWRDGKVERKHAYYQRVGDKVFAAGYYLPRSSPEEAEHLLDDAVVAMTKDSDSTIEKINKLDKQFNRDDLYVFVVDEQTKQFVAHGYNRRLIRTDFRKLRSADGEPIGQEMLARMNGKQSAEIDYLWRNPMTSEKELKHTLMKRVGNYIVAVGYYTK